MTIQIKQYFQGGSNFKSVDPNAGQFKYELNIEQYFHVVLPFIMLYNG